MESLGLLTCSLTQTDDNDMVANIVYELYQQSA